MEVIRDGGSVAGDAVDILTDPADVIRVGDPDLVTEDVIRDGDIGLVTEVTEVNRGGSLYRCGDGIAGVPGDIGWSPGTGIGGVPGPGDTECVIVVKEALTSLRSPATKEGPVEVVTALCERGISSLPTRDDMRPIIGVPLPFVLSLNLTGALAD